MASFRILPAVILTVLFTVACSEYAQNPNQLQAQQQVPVNTMQAQVPQMNTQNAVAQGTTFDQQILSMLTQQQLDFGVWKQEQREELRKMVNEEVSRMLAPITTESQTLSKALTDIQEELQNTREEVGKLGDTSELLEAIKSINTTELAELRKEVREQLAAISALQNERDDYINKHADAEAEIDELNEEIKALTAEVQNLMSQDPTALPSYREMQERLKKISEERANTEVELGNLRKQVEELRTSNDALKRGDSGKTTPSDTVQDTYEDDFEALVTAVKQAERTDQVQYLVICDLKKGSLPKVNDVLSVLNEKDELITIFQVLQVDKELMQFGGHTIQTQGEDPRKPLKGERVLKPRKVIDSR